MASITELLTAAVVVYIAYEWMMFHRIRAKLAHIPTMGSDWFILSYFNAWKFVFKGHEMLAEGYVKYDKLFKLPNLATSSRWLIIVNDLDMVEELRTVSSDILSFRGAARDLLSSDYLMDNHHQTAQFHVPVVKHQLTRNYASRFEDICEEIRLSFEEYLNPPQDQWSVFRIHEVLVHAVCRSSNRFFVGFPFCRDSEYLKIQENWTLQVALGGVVLQVTPQILKPLVSTIMYRVHASRKRMRKILEPVLKERLDQYKQNGDDWEGKPNDVIAWLIEAAPPEHRNVKDIALKIMVLNFAAIHTTSMTSGTALLDLAARQEYIEPLRAEIKECIEKYGWTKEAMGRMRKLDSFVKESGRLNSHGQAQMRRKATKDFVFSNGVCIPAGMSLAVSAGALQVDPIHYKNPETFQGFRFSEKREQATEELDAMKNQMVSLDPTYMIFGFGRHACPGRFFAASEIKAILAHIILNYDFKLPGDATEPPATVWFGANRVPKASTEVLFRRRKAEVE